MIGFAGAIGYWKKSQRPIAERMAPQSSPSRRCQIGAPVEADGGGLHLPGQAADHDEDRGHARAEGEHEAHSGGQAAQGRGDHQQADRVPAGDQAAGQSQADEAQVAPRRRVPSVSISCSP